MSTHAHTHTQLVLEVFGQPCPPISRPNLSLPPTDEHRSITLLCSDSALLPPKDSRGRPRKEYLRVTPQAAHRTTRQPPPAEPESVLSERNCQKSPASLKQADFQQLPRRPHDMAKSLSSGLRCPGHNPPTFPRPMQSVHLSVHRAAGGPWPPLMSSIDYLGGKKSWGKSHTPHQKLL